MSILPVPFLLATNGLWAGLSPLVPPFYVEILRDTRPLLGAAMFRVMFLLVFVPDRLFASGAYIVAYACFSNVEPWCLRPNCCRLRPELKVSELSCCNLCFA